MIRPDFETRLQELQKLRATVNAVALTGFWTPQIFAKEMMASYPRWTDDELARVAATVFMPKQELLSLYLMAYTSRKNRYSMWGEAKQKPHRGDYFIHETQGLNFGALSATELEKAVDDLQKMVKDLPESGTYTGYKGTPNGADPYANFFTNQGSAWDFKPAGDRKTQVKQNADYLRNKAPAYLQHSLDVLGITWPFTADEAKTAHRSTCMKTHPDKEGGSNEAFQKTQTAWSAVEQYLEKRA